jgi:hypothetical protein
MMQDFGDLKCQLVRLMNRGMIFNVQQVSTRKALGVNIPKGPV